MANIFNITILATDIKADDNGKATAVFTVTNVLDRPVRGIAKAKALGDTQQEWLGIKGEAERDFKAKGTEQFAVDFNKPVGPAAPGTTAAPPEKFPFRLDVFSANNPDEEFTEGQTVNVEVKQPAAPAVKKFPWWILIVIGVVLILGVILLVVFLSRRASNPPINNANNAAVTFTTEFNTNRPGADFKNFDLQQPNFELCRRECAGDPNCRAYTYVNPGVQGPSARCWLKSSVPAPTAEFCCISGVKNQ